MDTRKPPNSVELTEAFLAAVSHEVRTPFSAILGFAETLLCGSAGPVTPAQQEQLEVIRRSASQALALADDLVELTRLQAGHVVPQPRRVRAGHLVGQAVATVREAAAARQLRLVREGAGDDLDLDTDPQLASGILARLADNAVKFTAQGTVTLGAHRAADGGVEFRVTDTGCGIPPESHARLFQPLGRIGPRRGGAGLGLYLAQACAGVLGGRIEFESQPARGSRFSLLLPQRPPAPG